MILLAPEARLDPVRFAVRRRLWMIASRQLVSLRGRGTAPLEPGKTHAESAVPGIDSLLSQSLPGGAEACNQ